jgi:hypothetical protein
MIALPKRFKVLLFEASAHELTPWHRVTYQMARRYLSGLHFTCLDSTA